MFSISQVKVRRTAAAAALRAVPAAFEEALVAARAVPGALVEAVAAVAGLCALWAQLQLVTVRRTLLPSSGGEGDGGAVAAKAEDRTDDEGKTFDEGEAAAAVDGDGTTRPAAFTPVAQDPNQTMDMPSKSKSRDGEVKRVDAEVC